MANLTPNAKDNNRKTTKDIKVTQTQGGFVMVIAKWPCALVVSSVNLERRHLCNRR